ncbi:VapE domain-containing protein, partial [Proteiniphilum sp. UBA5510]|uniref:VapE domain-containing protein n=1 Tax=Proteiniphilum sp. UBA5510 TaxID=1947286 RepID=UPI00257DD767
LNSFKRELDTIGIGTSAENLRAILESDFSPKRHPVKEYFNSLPKMEPTADGNIAKLCDTACVTNPDKWHEYLTKWLIGVVANAMNDVGCQNHTCLVLTGEQGKFKTT